MLAPVIDKTGEDNLKFFNSKEHKLTKEQFILSLKKSAIKAKTQWASHLDSERITHSLRLKLKKIVHEGYQDYLEVCNLFEQSQVILQKTESYLYVLGTKQPNIVPLAINDPRISKSPAIAIYDAMEFSFSSILSQIEPDHWSQINVDILKLCINITGRKWSRLNSLTDLIVTQYDTGKPEEVNAAIEKINSLQLDDIDQITNQSLEFSVIGANTQLMEALSMSFATQVCGLIDLGADINKYSLLYGNNPILFAVSKGWNHQDGDKLNPDNNKSPIKRIIEKMLEQTNLDINCIHLLNGMTPLHIACLRGDPLDLIKQLVQHGADINALDYLGKRPLDYVGLTYKEVQIQVSILTSGLSLNLFEGNKAPVATLPTEQDFERNSQEVKEFFTTPHFGMSK